MPEPLSYDEIKRRIQNRKIADEILRRYSGHPQIEEAYNLLSDIADDILQEVGTSEPLDVKHSLMRRMLSNYMETEESK